MSEQKHTPGPWQVFDNRDEPEDITSNEALIGVTPASEQHDVAYCYIDTDRSEDEILANSRLIAAAPELFELLREIEDSDENIKLPGTLHARIAHLVNAMAVKMLRRPSDAS